MVKRPFLTFLHSCEITSGSGLGMRLCLDHTTCKPGNSKNDEAKIQACATVAKSFLCMDLCSFLGLASYYSRFRSSFSKVANPLTRKRVQFLWRPFCQEVFERLKHIFAFPNFDQDIVLERDVSGVGLRAILA